MSFYYRLVFGDGQTIESLADIDGELREFAQRHGAVLTTDRCFSPVVMAGSDALVLISNPGMSDQLQRVRFEEYTPCTNYVRLLPLKADGSMSIFPSEWHNMLRVQCITVFGVTTSIEE